MTDERDVWTSFTSPIRQVENVAHHSGGGREEYLKRVLQETEFSPLRRRPLSTKTPFGGKWNPQQKLAMLPKAHFGNDMFALLSDAAGQASCGKMMSVMCSLSMRRLRKKDKSLQGKDQSCLTVAAEVATG